MAFVFTNCTGCRFTPLLRYLRQQTPCLTPSHGLLVKARRHARFPPCRYNTCVGICMEGPSTYKCHFQQPALTGWNGGEPRTYSPDGDPCHVRLLANEHKLVESYWPSSMRALLGESSILQAPAHKHQPARKLLNQVRASPLAVLEAVCTSSDSYLGI